LITSEKKQEIIKDLQNKEEDTGSPAVQVGILTKRIEELTAHLKTNKHDFMARRGLLQMVGKRKRLLKYIAQKDSKQYLGLIKKLGIRRSKTSA
jgi:small subunit ribosomal protein S15